MPAYLEVWRPEGTELVPLETARVSVGRAESNDVAGPTDGKASRLHAVFERLPGGWCVRDLSSRNGTFVNGKRVDRDQPIYPGDEIRVGDIRLVYRAERTGQTAVVTGAAEQPPELTRRERDVLLALFRPALSGEVFTEPASTSEIARALSVSEPAVKQHLLKLYDKFGIYETGERRRVRLANEALRRGAVTLAEVRAERRP
jgi:DNA-binding transcriptional ArsR family regulator